MKCSFIGEWRSYRLASKTHPKRCRVWFMSHELVDFEPVYVFVHVVAGKIRRKTLNWKRWKHPYHQVHHTCGAYKSRAIRRQTIRP